MIWVDFTFIGLVGVCAVIGFLRGLDKETFSLLFWILASWVGLNLSRQFSVFLEHFINHPIARLFASFIALFAITLAVGGLIGFLVSLVSKNKQPTFMRRFGGMVIGAIRGLLVVTLVVLLAGFTPLPKDAWWAESMLIPPFQLCAIWLRDHISSGMTEYIGYR